MSAGQWVIYAAYALVAIATYLVSHLLLKEEESRAAQESLEDAKDRKSSSGLLKFARPFFTQYVVPMVRGKKFWDARRKDYRRKIISAGLKDEVTPDEFISFKFFLVVFFPIVMGLLNALDVLEAGPLMITGAAAGGWFYPDLWVRGRIQARQSAILKTLPFTVDLLALSTEAGLDFVGAIGKVVEKSPRGPLVDELEQVLKEIRVGSSRADALRELAARVQMREIGSFVSVLVSADQMGASVGKILRQQSEQIRSERFVRAEKEGAKTAPKLILATVVLILPAVMAMIAGPFVLSLLGVAL